MVNSAPLSLGQEALWLAEELVPGLSSYVVVAAWEIAGPVDADALEWALGRIVDRHEVLRSALVEVDARMAQVPRTDVSFVLERMSVPGRNGTDLSESVRAWHEHRLGRPFDLTAPPLLHATLISAGDQNHALLVDTH